MQRLEVSCAVRHIYIYMLLGAEGLTAALDERDWSTLHPAHFTLEKRPFVPTE